MRARRKPLAPAMTVLLPMARLSRPRGGKEKKRKGKGKGKERIERDAWLERKRRYRTMSFCLELTVNAHEATHADRVEKREKDRVRER